MDKELIYVIGLRRSGHHAIGQWVFGHYDEVSYCNNRKPGKEVHLKEKVKFPVAISFEDKTLAKIKERPVILIDNNGKHIEFNKKTNILTLRDPFNWYASRLRNKHRRVITLNDIGYTIERWKEYAREFIGETNEINNKICINYNRWFSDDNYRRLIEEEAGWGVSDKWLYEINKIGVSSFSTHTKNPKEIDFLSRWKQMKYDAKYRDIKRAIEKDKEMMRLSVSIFGTITGTEGVS